MIGVPVKDRGEDPLLEERFGRAEIFCLIADDGTRAFVDNQAPDSTSGAGVQTVQMLADRDVDTVLAPEIGPKAIAALEPLGIRVFPIGQARTLSEVLALFRENRLEERKGLSAPGGLRRA